MDVLEIAVSLAQEAGGLLRERLDAPRDIQEKHARDLVTDADRASEALIVGRLHELRPQSSILGEETGVTNGSNDERWIIDPLDGTTNYAHRYPVFCVSVACEQAGQLVAGAIYAPMLNEIFAAGLGRGATRNGQPITVAKTAEVRSALVCTGFLPGHGERNMQNFVRASCEAQAVRRDGSAALDLASVACGRFDAFWEFDLKPWDVAAGVLIVREAGGVVATLEGDAWQLGAASLLATNSTLQQPMLRLLRDPL